jgi:predicted anti-sigma-YlaC factor YlaD
MGCERWRELVSAQLDGEDDPADRALAGDHLAGCAGCRRWLDRAATVNRLTGTALAMPAPDLSAAILAALPPARPRLRLVTPARLHAALAVVGAVQLILGLTQVGGGAYGAHVPVGLDATPGHLWHESAAWNVAVGAAFLFIGLRRNRPSGLVPMLTAFVATLVLLSVNDLWAGRVDATRLAGHGFVIAGYLLVLTLSGIAPGPVQPPGARVSGGSGWRARFDDAEPGAAPTAPALRLVPRGPTTAGYDSRVARGPRTAAPESRAA